MLCGGHAGRAHRKILEKRQKKKILPPSHIETDFPFICKEYQSCKCVMYHSSGCGCLSDTCISKAHTTFTSIAQSQDEFVRRVKALPRHAVDDHSQCDYHPLVVCFCGACENKDQISCQGKPYKTKFRLDCKFHALLYMRVPCESQAGEGTDSPCPKQGSLQCIPKCVH